MEVTAEEVRAGGRPDDPPRGAAAEAAGAGAEGERAEAIGQLLRGRAGQEDGIRPKVHALWVIRDSVEFIFSCRQPAMCRKFNTLPNTLSQINNTESTPILTILSVFTVRLNLARNFELSFAYSGS